MFKIRAFPRADINCLYEKLNSLLIKEPTNIILYIGTNDAPYKSSNIILEDILQLKAHINSRLPKAHLFISCPVLRFDTAKAGLTLQSLRNKLKRLPINLLCNENIDASCIGRLGLHPNGKVPGRLAINFISLMQYF